MMLESKQYDWTPEEVKEMGQIVREKSEYMSKLIEDLNLTYRLKNAALPIERRLINVVPFIRNVTNDFTKNTFSEGYDIAFETKKEDILSPLMKRGSAVFWRICWQTRLSIIRKGPPFGSCLRNQPNSSF